MHIATGARVKAVRARRIDIADAFDDCRALRAIREAPRGGHRRAMAVFWRLAMCWEQLEST
jgi:hypothetical protein